MVIRIFIILLMMLVPQGLGAYASEFKYCEKLDFTQWTSKAKKDWQGREVVAFASWCSSCKEKIFAARTSPEKYVLVSVFEDIEASNAVLRKLKVDAPCVYGEDLAGKLGVHSLPWSQKI